MTIPRVHDDGARRGDDRRHAGFQRAVGKAELNLPLRSDGGHRPYSRHQLRVAARVRELVDAGTPIDAVCRIVTLEGQLADALRWNEGLRQHQGWDGSSPPRGAAAF